MLNTNGVAAQQPDTLQNVVPSIDTTNGKGFLKRTAVNVFNRYFNDTSDSENSKFLLYPTLAYSPETRLEVGLSSLLLYYAKRDTMNRLSEISALTFFTLNKQFGAWFDHFLYSDKDKWFFLGRLRLQRFPLLYFGIGPDAQEENRLTINADYLLIRERVLRNIGKNLFLGLETDFQKVSRTSIEAGNGALAKPIGADGSLNIGLGLGLVYDNRHNALNVRKGLFAEAAFLQYGKPIGGDFNFRTLNIDTRLFKTVAKNQVLATQLYGQFMGGSVPFNQMALIGGESLMRGYYLGRFRDKNMVVAQAEYRFLPFPFSKRLGGAVFASAGAVAARVGDFSVRNVLPAGGAGVRFLLFPKKDIFIRFDVAVTREGTNLYIFTGEAF